MRGKLAFLGAFLKFDRSIAAGTNHAGHTISLAMACASPFPSVDAFYEDPARLLRPSGMGPRLDLPKGRTVRVLDKRRLPSRRGEYDTVYAFGGQQLLYIPHAIRPLDDWTPVICEVDITHNVSQWSNLFIASMTGFLRPTDGLVFKAAASEAAFRRVWDTWQDRFGRDLSFPHSLVSLNPIDLEDNRRRVELRADTRRSLGLAEDDVIFLGFSRIEPHTKGNMEALVVHWRDVVERSPRALLALAGASTGAQRPFAEGLMALARHAGIGDRVLVLGNPFELWPDARHRLMSCADVFVHLTTGLEEACPLTLLEAMAHELPPIASEWSGIPQVVSHGETGWLVPTRYAAVPASLGQCYMATDPIVFNGDVSRMATCDYPRFVELAVAVASDAELRGTVGARARQAVMASHDVDRRARERLDFVEQLAREAERAWPLSESERSALPLIEPESVLDSLAGERVNASHLVRLGNQDNARFLPSAETGEWRAATIRILDCLQEKGHPIPLSELAESVLITTGSTEPAHRLDGEASLLFLRHMMQLTAYGVVAMETPLPSEDT